MAASTFTGKIRWLKLFYLFFCSVLYACMLQFCAAVFCIVQFYATTFAGEKNSKSHMHSSFSSPKLCISFYVRIESDHWQACLTILLYFIMNVIMKLSKYFRKSEYVNFNIRPKHHSSLTAPRVVHGSKAVLQVGMQIRRVSAFSLKRPSIRLGASTHS